jgi:predicted RNA-binding protein associated with RNAse of E/G family
MKRIFRELRLHSHKPPQEFLCDLLHQEEKYAVLRYRSAESYAFGPVVIEKGSVTIAHYWEERNYILWFFKKPDASLCGYLFHIVRDVEIGADCVRYVDLELDIWFSPGGSPTVLDEDEVKDYYKNGIFDDRTLSLIEEQKKAILKNFRTIIKDVWSNEEDH